MIDFSRFDSLVSLVLYFDTEKKCRQTLLEARWGSEEDIVCPYCGSHHCHKRKDGRFVCDDCNHNFSETVGTIFENTRLPLMKWFMAMYLVSNNKKGISSHQLARDIKVTQTTAWYMLHKVRSLFTQSDEIALGGPVQCDEAYLGGRESNKHEWKKQKGMQGGKGKAPVFGMVDGNGRVFATKVAHADSETVCGLIGQFVEEGSAVYTDDSSIYDSLDGTKYAHYAVKHSAKEYARFLITTNSIEGFWSEMKRMIFGIHHWVSPAYLQRYIDEAVYRHNTKKTKEYIRFKDMFLCSIGKFSYADVRAIAA